jgi:RimJ/RimL family protein N-acetyltransferase
MTEPRGSGAEPTVSLRPAEPADVDFLVTLANDDETEPYLSARQPRDRDAVAREVEEALREPDRSGRIVIEVEGQRAGTVAWRVVNPRSSIVRLERLSVDPAFRGRGVAAAASRRLQRELLVERGFHRLELEIYAFNTRALALAERVGYVREGLKRRAYHRHGTWNDAVLYGLLADDLDGGSAA